MQLVKWVMGTDMREKDVAVVACTGVGALGVGTGLSLEDVELENSDVLAVF